MTEPTIHTALTSWGEGAAPADTAALVLFLHGYGSNAGDLAGLGAAVPAGYAWASLEAPLAMGHGGFAWFAIESPGDPDAEPVQRAAAAIEAWLAENVPATATVVPFGFSQGGLMASQLLRSVPRRAAAAVITGGFVLSGEQPGDAALALERPPVFNGRGALDTVITAAAVARTADWLPGHTTLTDRTYPGLAHGISPDELADAVAFLTALRP